MPEPQRGPGTPQPPVLIGLLADPDLPAELAKHLADALPRALAQADGARDWRATVHVGPLVPRPAGGEGPPPPAVSPGGGPPGGGPGPSDGRPCRDGRARARS